MQTTSRLDSPRPCWQRRNWRPMRPKPLMATLSFFSAVASTLLALQRVCTARRPVRTGRCHVTRAALRACAPTRAHSAAALLLAILMRALRLRGPRVLLSAVCCYYGAVLRAPAGFPIGRSQAHIMAPSTPKWLNQACLQRLCQGEGSWCTAALCVRRAGETRAARTLRSRRCCPTHATHSTYTHVRAVAAPWAPRCGGRRRSGPS